MNPNEIYTTIKATSLTHDQLVDELNSKKDLPPCFMLFFAVKNNKILTDIDRARMINEIIYNRDNNEEFLPSNRCNLSDEEIAEKVDKKIEYNNSCQLDCRCVPTTKDTYLDTIKRTEEKEGFVCWIQGKWNETKRISLPQMS
jgi:hypothetical protein